MSESNQENIRTASDEIDFIKQAKTFLERRHDVLTKEFRELEHVRKLLEELDELRSSGLNEAQRALLSKTLNKIKVMKKVYEMEPSDLVV